MRLQLPCGHLDVSNFQRQQTELTVLPEEYQNKKKRSIDENFQLNTF